MIKNVMLKIKEKIDKVLIIIGFVLLVLFILYTKKNNISTSNTWEAYIGFVLFYLPLLSGVWILSNKIKEKKRRLSIILKVFICFACVSLLGSFITFLINL